jgi:hypothetical protein
MAGNPSISTFTAGGQTVALQWTTASNAAIAQKTMASLESLVASGAETVVSYTGGGVLPPLPSTLTGIVVAQGAGSAAHGPVELNGNYDAGMSNDTSAAAAPQSWIVGPGSSNDTVMVGGGGGQVANFGSNTQVYMTGQNIGSSTVPAPQFLQEIGLLGGAQAPSAEAWIDGQATVDGSFGSTTVHLDTVRAVVTMSATGPEAPLADQLSVLNNGAGQNIVNIATSSIPAPASPPAIGTTFTGAGMNVVSVSGSGTVATINGAGATGSVGANTIQPTLRVFANGGTVVVNGGAGPVQAFSNTGTGIVSVNGGTGAYDLDAGVGGYFQSGTGGNAILAGSTTQATTLVGGGNNDVMYAYNQRTTMIAGVGTQTEVGAATVGGVTFMGNPGAGASTTTMEDQAFWVGGPGAGGHATFITGNGIASIIAAASGITGAPVGHNTYQEGVSNSGNNAATIFNFDTSADSSQDIVSLARPGGGFYTPVFNSTFAAPGQIAVNVSGGNTTLTFGDGTKWTMVGAALTGTNFH